MNKKDEWTYKNEKVVEDGIEPRDELKKFVVDSYYPLITDKKKDKIFDTYKLSGRNDEEKIKEFVETNYPAKVLEMCFNAGHLHDIAEEDYKIMKVEGHSDEQIIEEILFRMGFKKEIHPSGLTQFRAEYEPKLDKVRDNTELEPTIIDGFLADMAREMQDLMKILFLFHSGVLREKLEELDDAENYIKLDKFCNDYKEEKKQLGDYVKYLYKLMKIFEPNEAPLKPHLLAEINFFVVFRNLTLKNPDEKFWEQNESNADKSIELINNPENEWTEIWNRVVEAWNNEQDFPKYDMFQRMVAFFQDFLRVLVKDNIYPKVIVMQYHKYDKYGSHTIHAIDDAGNGADFVYVHFNPFEQYYYQARTNPISISPTLVEKDGLQDWAIPPEKKPDEQKKS